MKKLLLLLVLTLLLVPRPCPAGDRACQPIWDDVASQTYTLVADNQSFDVVFSGAYAGPCPQGVVEIYDGIYIAPVLECTYTSRSNNLVVVDCSGSELIFQLDGNKLRIVDPDAPFMTRKEVEE